MYATLLITLTLFAQKPEDLRQNPEGLREGETALVHAFRDRGLALADGRSGVPATTATGLYSHLETCMKANDVEGLRRMIALDMLTLVPVGTRVLVREVATVYDIDRAEVRVLDGPDKGEVRRLPVQFLTRNPRLATVPKAKAAKKKPPLRKATPKKEAPIEED